MAKNTTSVLDTLLAAETAVKAAAAPTAPVKTAAPSKPTAPTSAVKTVAPPVKIDGFSLGAADGLPENVKESMLRETSNPWYPLAVWLAGADRARYVVISRDGDAKSPMAKLDSAIARCRKAGVKNYGKLDAKSSTEKGVWYLIRRA